MPAIRHSRLGLATAAALLALTTTALTGAPASANPLGEKASLQAPAAVLPGLTSTAPLPTAAGISKALAGPLSDPGLGGTPHVEVVDAITGRILLDRLGQAPAIPASTMKLLTASAALLVLGPRTRFTTRVLAYGPDIYLVGGGDPTLSTQPLLAGAYPATADLTALARSVAGSHKTIRNVIGVGNLYGGPDDAIGWSPSYLADGEVARVRSLTVDEAKFSPGLGPSVRYDDPVLSAAQTFQAALVAAGAQAGPASVGAAPRAAKVIASVSSPPVSALIERMLNYSDDDVAEGLGRQVAIRSGLPPTFAGTGTALGRVARRLGMPGVTSINDASGLSRADALSPAALTTLLRAAAQGPDQQLRALLPALPTAGFSGTLAARFTVDASAGVGSVRAKTGWLNGAAGLAGLVTTADGRLLIFAALAPATIRSAGEAALDRLAGTLAECGCR